MGANYFHFLAGMFKLDKEFRLVFLITSQEIILKVVDHTVEADKAHDLFTVVRGFAEMLIGLHPLSRRIHGINLIGPEKQQRKKRGKKCQYNPEILMKIFYHENSPLHRYSVQNDGYNGPVDNFSGKS